MEGGDVEQWRIDGQQPQGIDKRPAWKADRQEDGSRPTAMTCASDGRWVAVGYAGGQVSVLDFSSPSDPRVFENHVDNWPENMKKDEDMKKDLSVSALLYWPGKDWLIAVFQRGPIGLLKPTSDHGFVYLLLTASSEAELKCAAARGRTERQEHRSLLHAAFDPNTGDPNTGDPNTGRLVVGDSFVELWKLSELFIDKEGTKPASSYSSGGAESSDKVYYANASELKGGLQATATVAALAFIKRGDSVATGPSQAPAPVPALAFIKRGDSVATGPADNRC